MPEAIHSGQHPVLRRADLEALAAHVRQRLGWLQQQQALRGLELVDAAARRVRA